MAARLNVLLEILKDDRALVEGARGRVCVELECGNEALRRDLEELCRFLVWIYFICARATCQPPGRMTRWVELNNTARNEV
jgi:hypothetical protein